MRMRNKPWAMDYLNEHKQLVVTNPHEYKGKWNELLNRDVLHLEIGSGKGDYWSKMAGLYPNIGWIGFEKDKNVSVIAIKKVLDSYTDNMKFVVHDAKDLTELFADHEVDTIHLNFSDPWPKNRTAKRRLTHSDFLENYKRVLKVNGQLIMKTDNKILFEYSLIEFQNNGWEMIEVSVDFRREPHPEDVCTEYETKFMELGQPIYRAVWRIKEVK